MGIGDSVRFVLIVSWDMGLFLYFRLFLPFSPGVLFSRFTFDPLGPLRLLPSLIFSWGKSRGGIRSWPTG